MWDHVKNPGFPTRTGLWFTAPPTITRYSSAHPGLPHHHAAKRLLQPGRWCGAHFVVTRFPAPPSGKTATATPSDRVVFTHGEPAYRTTMRQNGYLDPRRSRGVRARKTRLSHHQATERSTATLAMVWCSLRRNAVSQTTMRQNGYRNPQQPRGVHERRTRLWHHQAPERLLHPMAMVSCSSAANSISRTTKRQSAYCTPWRWCDAHPRQTRFPAPPSDKTFHHSWKRLAAPPRETFSPFVDPRGQVFRSDIHPCTVPPHEGRPEINVSSLPTR